MTTPHLARLTDNPDWWSPLSILDASRDALGGAIELDPASCAEANARVRAQRFYSPEDDGLALPWCSPALFVNPPYGRGIIQPWAEKFLAERPCIRAAIWLSWAATDTQWWQPLARDAAAAFFFAGRPHFVRPDGSDPGGPPRPAAALYFGDDPARFDAAFKPLGGITMIPTAGA